jgi:integrase
MLSLQILRKRIVNSEWGQEWTDDPLMNKDVWSAEELGYTKEESIIIGIRNIYFEDFFLPWLELLAKLTAKASARKKYSLSYTRRKVNDLKLLDKFLIFKGCSQPEIITNTLLEEFIFSKSTGQNERQSTINYVAKLWAEEEWLKIPWINHKYKQSTPKVETIPEEVLHQIYENFDLLPPPLERLFRLQIVLGCRIGELLKLPHQCLKKEVDKWFLLKWIEKRKHWQFFQIHPFVAQLVIEQQKFLNIQFGLDSDFDKLFCKASTANRNGASYGERFDVEPVYFQEVLSNDLINSWLQSFREKANLKDKHGNRFNLKSHHFRRTKASIMAYCEVEDEYIAAVLGHASLDMLPHYRKRSLERLEREANTKSYVDMYGRVTSFKPRKRRYEKLAELLKVNTTLGECHRPMMLGDCQYRYACLSCDHHRVTEEDKPQIEADIRSLEQDLEQAKALDRERRVTEINRLLELLKTRLQGFEKLKKLKE